MRKSGILMPVFSLPGAYGIGCFSESARRFVDFLADAGQSYCRFCRSGPRGTGIRRTSPSQRSRAIRILSALNV